MKGDLYIHTLLAAGTLAKVRPPSLESAKDAYDNKRGAWADPMMLTGYEFRKRVLITRREIFPDMAHDVMLEAGWQAVADRIVGWLGEQGV